MNTLVSVLQNIGIMLDDALPGIVFHYYRTNLTCPYLVWQETNEGDSFRANLYDREQAIEGTLDYFTQTEYDENIDTIQEVLNDLMITWNLESVQYEEDTRIIHYEWRWTKATALTPSIDQDVPIIPVK